VMILGEGDAAGERCRQSGESESFAKVMHKAPRDALELNTSSRGRGPEYSDGGFPRGAVRRNHEDGRKGNPKRDAEPTSRL
jgi:hypothetical protein